MVCHWLTWEATPAAVKAIEKTVAITAVRHVEGRVRSFVHSALRALVVVVIAVARTVGTGMLV
jgi:hypothetical protein